MNRKVITIAVCLVFTGFLAACGSENAAEIKIDNEVEIQNEVEESTESPVEETSVGSFEYDLDLTQMTSTMIYAEVYNMMLSPEEYIGKSIKLEGSLSVFQVPETGNVYYACIVQDATACCQKGIEFLPPDAFSDMNLANGDIITVSGTFETYYEGENMYCHLVDAIVFN